MCVGEKTAWDPPRSSLFFDCLRLCCKNPSTVIQFTAAKWAWPNPHTNTKSDLAKISAASI